MVKNRQKVILVIFLTIIACSTVFATDEALEESVVENELQILPSAQLAMSTTDYLVSAGDVYELAYAGGNTSVSYIIPVDTTYKIRISNLGVINVRGLTYNQLKAQVELIVTKNYPLSGVQFILKTPAAFKVLFNGEVKKTTEIQVWALTRLSDVVPRVMTGYSSIRDVKITSDTGREKVCDLFSAQRLGDLNNNPYLRPGDTITINKIKRRVTITGSVERPGTYELLKDENLQTLITKYGNGLAPSADLSRISVKRINDTKNSGISKYITDYTIDQDIVLENYDIITIPSYKEIAPAMFITGAVATGTVATDLEATVKIPVTFSKGINYATLVRANKTLFSSSSDTKNAYILRRGNRIAINLDKILYDTTFYSDIFVEADDELVIPFKQYFVVVSGAVLNPGRFPYIPDRDYNYYIAMAGGIDSVKNARGKITITDAAGNILSKSDELQPECTIKVASNSWWYKWTTIAGGVTALLTIVSTLITVLSATGIL